MAHTRDRKVRGPQAGGTIETPGWFPIFVLIDWKKFAEAGVRPRSSFSVPMLLVHQCIRSLVEN